MSMSELYTTIEVEDIDIFCRDYDANILQELKNKFKGKCFMGQYIIDILELLNVSECVITNTNNTCNGIINVKFKVDSVKFAVDDILVGVNVIKNENNMLQANYKGIMNVIVNSNIHLPSGKDHVLQFVTGEIINVVIKNVLHMPFDKINASTSLLLPNPPLKHWRIEEDALANSLPHELTERITLEKEKLKTYSPEVIKFLRDAYGINKNDGDFEITADLKPGVYSCSTDRLMIKKSTDDIVLITPPKVAYISMAAEILKWTTALNEMAFIYDKETIAKNKKLFQTLRLITK